MPRLFEDYATARVRPTTRCSTRTSCRTPYRASPVARGDDPDRVCSRVEALQASYLDQGVTFDIGGEERAFPLDILPRVIEMDTWSTIERGVQQRVRALEAFLADVYDAGQVLRRRRRSRAAWSPPRRTSTAPPPACEPPNGVRVHVSRHRPDPRRRRRVPGARGQRAGAVRGLLRDDQPARDRRRAARDRSPSTGSVRSPATRSGCSPRCAPPHRPASPTRPSSCSPRASSTAPTSSTRCSPARWASSWSRAATSSAAAAA